MFSSTFLPVKLSLKKSKTMEELTQKLNKTSKQLCDLLLSKHDQQCLADIIDYCMNGMMEHASKSTGSGQQPMNPDLDDPANRVMETPQMNQNLGSQSHLAYDNPAVNPGYQVTAPSLASALVPAQLPGNCTPFQSPTPYHLSLLSASPANSRHMQAETILDESNLYPSAVDE